MKRVLINVEDRELRIAILEDEQLTELYIEPLDDKTILNNIYKGRVEGVLPGLSAAFVNVGFERNAFLHFDDVRPDLLLELQAKHEGRPLPTPPPIVEPEEDEDEVPEGAVASAQPSQASLVAGSALPGQPSQQSSSRKRRRGRRGGRNRRKRQAGQAAAQTAAQPPLPTEGVAAADGLVDSAVTAQEARENSAEPVSVSPASELPASQASQGQEAATSAAQGHASGKSKSKAGRQRQQKQRSRQGSHAARHPQRVTSLPPPDAIRGTRAASNPYDVFTPYALPKKQKTEKKRRQKSSQRPTLDHIIGPTTLPPDVPIEKDSQLDFFGPAQPSTSYVDEPYEEPAPAATRGNVGGEDFLDEANGNVETSGQPTAGERKSKRGQRRSMRRKNSAPYAVRRSKKASSGEDEAVTEASDSAEKKSVRRRPSAKTRAASADAEPTEAVSQDDQSAASMEEVPAPKAGAEETEQKALRRVSRRKKTEVAAETAAPEPMAPAAPGGESTGVAAEELPKSAAKSRLRTRKKTAAHAAEAPVSAVQASETATAPTSDTSPVAAPSTKPRRRKKATASEVVASSSQEEQAAPQSVVEQVPPPDATAETRQEASTLVDEEEAPHAGAAAETAGDRSSVGMVEEQAAPHGDVAISTE